MSYSIKYLSLLCLSSSPYFPGGKERRYSWNRRGKGGGRGKGRRCGYFLRNTIGFSSITQQHFAAPSSLLPNPKVLMKDLLFNNNMFNCIYCPLPLVFFFPLSPTPNPVVPLLIQKERDCRPPLLFFSLIQIKPPIFFFLV